jgi:hypothetical protein
MRAEGYSLEHVDRLIDFLENKIETNTVMPAVLAGVQEQLDAIDAACRDHPEFEQYYSRMLELQALIYGEGNQEQKALEFLKEAVRQTGSSRITSQITASPRPRWCRLSKICRWNPSRPALSRITANMLHSCTSVRGLAG